MRARAAASGGEGGDRHAPSDSKPHPGMPDPRMPGGPCPVVAPSALAKLAAENEAGSSGHRVKRTGGDGRQQIRSLVQGAELIVKPAGELPWYPLPAFDMQGLPCAIAPPVELRFSTNHTAEKQPRDRDGEPIPRRLRNIVMVLMMAPLALSCPLDIGRRRCPRG